MHIPVGIDPASGKKTCIWYNDSYEFVKPQNVRAHLEYLFCNNNEKYIIAWDAPISFSNISYSDRLIDKVSRRWVKTNIENNIFEKKAISALPFSGLSHWVISCKALGVPFGEPLINSSLAMHQKYYEENRNLIIEVHPAMSMGLMWVDASINTPFPVYKKSKPARELIVKVLGFPEVCIESDDILDAYVANLMAKQFISYSAMYLNNPRDGSYVLPVGNSFDHLSELAKKTKEIMG